MAYSSLLFGESATMASESAVLGVPAVYLDNKGRCYTNEEESKYKIVFNYTESNEDQEKAILKGCELLKENELNKYKIVKKRILKDKISFTDFLIWIIENYPNSISELEDNPEIQNQFILSYEN
ncbi:MAG: hypothetical protein P8I80_02905 [Bacteroidales bacterium]|nr:hypothetical protein [Bacteroidales bacterium]